MEKYSKRCLKCKNVTTWKFPPNYCGQCGSRLPDEYVENEEARDAKGVSK